MHLFVGNRTSFLKPYYEDKRDICCVVTKANSRIDEYCQQNSIETKYFTDRNSLLTLIENLSFEVLLSAGCPYVLPRQITEQRHRKFINIHPSLLPKYPGMHSITEALYKDGPFGVTIHTMEEKVDNGLIIAQSEFEVLPSWTAKEIFGVFFDQEEKLVKQSLLDGKLDFKNYSTMRTFPLIQDANRFKRDDNFRRIEPWMTINEIAKRVAILNVENQHAFIQVAGKKRFIQDVFLGLNTSSGLISDQVVTFGAKDGVIGLVFL